MYNRVIIVLKYQRSYATIYFILFAYRQKQETYAMKTALTINELIKSARRFCEIESLENHVELIGVTDGKAVGTYVEHKFQQFL